ncbi:MAG: hypothetical protein V4813_17750 [Gemmatimonadota bacterium]
MRRFTASAHRRPTVHTRQLLTAVVAVAAISACSGGSKGPTQVTEPPASTIALSVAGSGTGSGKVVSQPAGIDCVMSAGSVSGTCTARFSPGTLVTLQTEPATTSVFLAFSGDCTSATCQTTMQAPRVVTATFVPNVLSVVAHAQSVGGGHIVSTPAGIDCTVAGAAPGTGVCSASFPLNTVVSLEQQPIAGALFQAWGSACTGTTCTVTLTGQRTVDAIYRLPTAEPAPTPPSPTTPTTPPPPAAPSTLTVSPSPASRGSGNITSSPAGISCGISDGTTSGVCSVAFAHGTVVTLTQSPSGNSIFQGWSGDCIGNPCQLTMTQARTGEMTYRVPAPGIITVSGSGSGNGAVTSSPSGIACTITAGAVSGICSASFEAGSSVTLIGGSTQNGSFDGFGGACVGATCTIAVISAVTSGVTVGFTPAPQRLTVAPGAGSAGSGVITSTPAGISCVINGTSTSGTCSSTFAANAAVLLQQSTSGNAVFNGWAGDCSTDPCQLGMSQARTALAIFKTQGITISGGGTGSGVVTSSPSGISCVITAGVTGGTCTSTFPANTVVTLTATPTGLASFSGYTGACNGSTCTTTMVTGATAAITAQFAAPPTLAMSAASGSEGGGTISSAPTGVSCTLSHAATSGTCTSAYALNTSVTLTQVPTSGSVFLYWLGACSGSADSCSVALTQSKTVQALYRLAVPGSVTVMAGTGAGNGSVSTSPGGVACSIANGVKSGICRAIFPVGSTVTLIASPASGSTFTGFSGSCSGMSCTLTVPENGDITVTANFAK